MRIKYPAINFNCALSSCASLLLRNTFHGFVPNLSCLRSKPADWFWQAFEFQRFFGCKHKLFYNSGTWFYLFRRFLFYCYFLDYPQVLTFFTGMRLFTSFDEVIYIRLADDMWQDLRLWRHSRNLPLAILYFRIASCTTCWVRRF